MKESEFGCVHSHNLRFCFFPSEKKLTCRSNKSSGATGAITDDQITLFSFHSCGIVDADSLYHFNVTSLNTCAVFTVL